MKGLLLKYLSMEEWNKPLTKDTMITYKPIECENPAEVIWTVMADDLKELYSDDSNYGIILESSKIDCPIPDATSWGGYSYQWTKKLDRIVHVCAEVWYIFIEAEQM